MVFAKHVQLASSAAATTHDIANCVCMTPSKTLSRSLHVSNVLHTLARFGMLAGNQYQSVCAVLGTSLCLKQDCVRLAQQTLFAPTVTSLANESEAECLQCPAHNYCPAGSIHPLSCPLGEVAAPASHSRLHCQCPSGSGRYASAQNCTLSPHGFFSSFSSNTECTLCTINKTTMCHGRNDKRMF
jgi:hypothetical protein